MFPFSTTLSDRKENVHCFDVFSFVLVFLCGVCVCVCVRVCVWCACVQE